MDRREFRADRLFDALGAAAAGVGAAVSAWLVAVEYGLAPLPFAAIVGTVGAVGGMMTMRAVSGGPKPAGTPFNAVCLEFEEGADVLLLEDVLVEPEANSRVVQLFSPDMIPTAGQLRVRIDRHLGRTENTSWDEPVSTSDEAATALHAALDDIRRTLQRS